MQRVLEIQKLIKNKSANRITGKKAPNFQSQEYLHPPKAGGEMEAGGGREAWRLAGVYLSTWALGPGGVKSGLNPFCLEYRARPPRRASTGDKIGFRDM